MNIEKVIREYLPQVIHMSLGTSRDNKPWVCEVHFAYDDELNLYYRSFTTRRHSQEIAANPQVAGSIVKQHVIHESPKGVYFEGTASIVKPGEEQLKAFQYLNQRIQEGDGILEEAQQPNGRQFYKIVVDTFYFFGILDSESPKKYELQWNGGNK